MVNQGISNFFRNVTASGLTNPQTSFNPSPMFNELNVNLRSFFNNRSQLGKKKVLMNWVKNTLELQNLVNKVSKDMTGKFHFENINPKESGRNKILKANKFVAETQYKRRKQSQNFDKLATGESYAWLGFISDKQIKNQINKSVGIRPNMETKEIESMKEKMFLEIKQTEGFNDLQGIDEDVLKPRKYDYIASSSMEIVFDRTDIKGYIQDVGGEKKPYTPKEIIRQTLADVDGKVSGFTSVESALVQLELLRFMWGNMMSLHKNGGAMDKIFILEDQNVNTQSYKRIKQQLEKYKLVENKHGNMLFTGKIKIEDLQQLDTMQFRDMGLYITSLLSRMWQVPNSSGGVAVEGGDSKDDTGGNSEKAYWENIEFYQERDAEIDNLQLWIPHFGVKLVYDKQYVQKDIQEETAKQLKLNNVKVIEEIARNSKKRLRFEEKVNMIGMHSDMFEDIPKEDLEMEMEVGDSLTGTKDQMSDSKINDSEAKKNVKAKKKQETVQNMNSSGKGTLGTGKEWDSNADMEYKQLIGSDDEYLPLKDFVKLYNSDRASNPGSSPRLFRRENPNFITFKYKSTDFVYRTIIDKELEEDNRVLIMNLSGNIYNL